MEVKSDMAFESIDEFTADNRRYVFAHVTDYPQGGGDFIDGWIVTLGGNHLVYHNEDNEAQAREYWAWLKEKIVVER